MKTLLVLRHAKAEAAEGLKDHDRDLKDRGKRDAERVGRYLAEQNLAPDAILSSTALRARKTADRVARESGTAAEVELRRDLYLAPPADIVRAIRDLEQDPRVLLVVGHNPGLEEWVSLLAGEDVQLATAALTHLVLPLEAWSELTLQTRGEVAGRWRPHEAD